MSSKPTTEELRDAVEAPLLRVAENVAKHCLQRAGWRKDDECFVIDLRRSQDAIVAVVQDYIEKLEAFKALVHERLDEMGIDKHEGEECRVGARLADVKEHIEGLEAEVGRAAVSHTKNLGRIAELEGQLSGSVRIINERYAENERLKCKLEYYELNSGTAATEEV